MKNDIHIREEVLKHLKQDLGSDSLNIDVIVTNGIAVLSGTLPTFFKKQNAEKSALTVTGLKAIVENIKVKQSPLTLEEDKEMALAIIENFQMNNLLTNNQIKVIVSGGDVILTGEVMWKYQKDLAMKIVKDFVDVHLIKNNIIINPDLSTTETEEDLLSKHREIEIDKSEWGVPL